MKFFLALLFILMASNVMAADKVITITIPSDKVEVALEGWLSLYPNDEVDENNDPIYTNAQWVTEKVRRLIIRDVRRGLQMLATQEAYVVEDNDLAITE